MGITLLYGVYGHPIAHSLSPALMNAAFGHYGLRAHYAAFDIDPARLGGAVEAIRCLGMGGVNVTIPHKRAVVPMLDEVTGEAGASGSVNTIANRNGRLIGHSTDGEGFLRALREETGYEPAGRSACLLGGGGAALAVALRLALEGAAGLTVVTRRKTLDWPPQVGAVPVRVASYEEIAADPGLLAGCDLLINTTPVGMHPRGEEMPPVPLDALRPGLVVYDLIYRPARTRLMAEAEKRGAKAVGGLGMLIHQAAASFEIWTDRPAPLEVMRAAALAALAEAGEDG